MAWKGKASKCLKQDIFLVSYSHKLPERNQFHFFFLNIITDQDIWSFCEDLFSLHARTAVCTVCLTIWTETSTLRGSFPNTCVWYYLEFASTQGMIKNYADWIYKIRTISIIDLQFKHLQNSPFQSNTLFPLLEASFQVIWYVWYGEQLPHRTLLYPFNILKCFFFPFKWYFISRNRKTSKEWCQANIVAVGPVKCSA